MIHQAEWDRQRQALGLMTIDAIRSLIDQGVTVLDPWSTVISSGVCIGVGTVLYPGVVLQKDPASTLELGEGNRLFAGSVLLALGGGHISVGEGCELGPGTVTIKANRPDVSIVVSDGVRLLNGCELVGTCFLGRGAQVLGTVSAQSVYLEGGLGGHDWPNPDERGAVIKGMGLARGVRLQRGEVVNVQGPGMPLQIERQSAYHATPDQKVPHDPSERNAR